MKCDKCKIDIADEEEREHKNQTLCEDCYMDVLSPTAFCDPWATYMAQSFAANNPETTLTDNQKIIMRVLKETGETDPAVLMERLKGHISPEDGERECATLHRMGKISIENRNGSVVTRPK